MSHASWQRQTNWVVNYSTGSNRADGHNSANAIKTNAELARRTGYPGTWGIRAPTTVTWEADHPTTDPLNLNVAMLHGGSFRGNGTPTDIRTSTLTTAVTALNRASGTGQCLQVKDGTFDWTSNAFNQLYIPSGTRAGARAWIAKDLTGGVTRLCPTSISTFDFNFPTDVTPVVGDPYKIRTLTQLPLGTLRIDSARYDNSGSDAANQGNLVDLHLVGSSSIGGGLVGSGPDSTNVVGCWLDNIWISMPGFFGETNRYTNCLIGQPGGCGFWGGLVTGAFAVSNGATALFDADMLCQGSGFVFVNNASCVRAGYVGIFDTALSDGSITLADSSHYASSHVFGASALTYGDNNTGHGIKCTEGGKFRHNGVMPTINSGRGAGREVLLGSIDYLLSQLTNGAVALPSQSSFGT